MTAVALFDVPDVQGFARQQVGVLVHHILKGKLPPDLWDELTEEGVVILYEMAAVYEHHRPGYSAPGSFAGYASKYLPMRLGDALPRLRHSEHICLHDSVEAERLPAEPPSKWDLGPTITDALKRIPPDQGGFMAHLVVHGIDEGLTAGEVAKRLRIDRGAISAVVDRIADAIREVTA